MNSPQTKKTGKRDDPCGRNHNASDGKTQGKNLPNSVFVLDNYRQYIIEQLKICPQINNTLIFRRLKETFPDFEIQNATFFRYMRRLREQTGLQKPKRTGAIRNEVLPGYEGQADFGQYVMKSMYGNNIRVYFFCMVLSYSRM